MLYTGLDFHRSSTYITTMNEKGEIIGQKKLPSNGEIVDYLKEFEDGMEVAIESTPSWYWLYDCLEDELHIISVWRLVGSDFIINLMTLQPFFLHFH